MVGGQEGYFVVFFFYYYFARRTARSRGEKGAGLSGPAVFIEGHGKPVRLTHSGFEQW